VTAILGISAFYHDSAAALVIDGRIVAAAQEERFTRRKHDAGLPVWAAAWCLREAGLTPRHLDYLAFYEKPLKKFDRLLETYLTHAPRGFASFSKAIPLWLKEKLYQGSSLRSGLGIDAGTPLVFTEHHESHAASAFYPSPFDTAAILTLDGVGEWATTTMGTGRGSRIDLTHQIAFPHSLGLLYSAFTYYCGFKVNSGEYKLMGLAPYGKPLHAGTILSELIDLKPDGSFWLNQDYFDYAHGLTMTGERFARLFGGPPRAPEAELTQRHMDLAASIQAVTEETVLRLGKDLHMRTGLPNLTLAGGVALNCVANGRLLREGPFKRIWIQPAAGDAGGALGAALFTWHQLMERPRTAAPADSQSGSLLGPSWSSAEVGRFLADRQVLAVHEVSEPALFERVSGLLEAGMVVGWFQGRMEFGPRALGARSILGDARAPEMQATMNVKIKFRESFRPFAPVVLAEHAATWFDLPAGHDSPYMMLVAPVAAGHRVTIDEHALDVMHHDPDLRKRVSIPRSTIPAVTHVDGSARIQTVDARHGRLRGLLETFHRRTGCPVLVNTSFNVRGEPIVCTLEDAYRCFLSTEMDVLVLEDHVIVKTDAMRADGARERKAHLAQFSLD
jgi:carbamoyltransferase